MFKVNRYEYFKDKVIYISVVDGAAYCSFHNRVGLTNTQAENYFKKEHSREVLALLKQKAQNEPIKF